MPHQFRRDGVPSTTLSINLDKREDPSVLTVPITGVPRGGTTMAAAVVHALGIDLGPPDDLKGFHFEDQTMHSPYHNVRYHYLQRRNQDYQRWGWKDPTGMPSIREMLYALRNPHVVIVFRDIVATVEGETRFDQTHGMSRPMIPLFQNSLRWWNDIAEYVSTTRVPTLLISYERAISNSVGFMTELIAFLRISPTEEQKKEVLSRISSKGYLVL